MVYRNMRKIKLGQEEWLRKILLSDEPVNIYMLSDLDNYGVSDKDVEFFYSEYDNKSITILMRFYNSFVVYSTTDMLDNYAVTETIRSRKNKWNELSCVSGKYSSVKSIALEEAYIRCTHVMVNRGLCYHKKRISNDRINVFGKESVDMIIDHYRSIPEMKDKYGNDYAAIRDDILRNLESGRVLGIEKDGAIVSSVMTTAESHQRAMFINVCTSPDYRRQGLASQVIEGLSELLFNEGKSALFIYYENEAAGEIYKRAGFEYVDDYGRVSIIEIK